MIELTDIAYVRSGVADLAAATDFATAHRRPGTGRRPPSPASRTCAQTAGTTASRWSEAPPA